MNEPDQATTPSASATQRPDQHQQIVDTKAVNSQSSILKLTFIVHEKNKKKNKWE
jgi:hypothetical protein